MREMEKARNQIREEDHPEFDRKVTPVKKEAISAIVKFMELHVPELTPFGFDGNEVIIGTAKDESPVRHRHRKEEGKALEFNVSKVIIYLN